MMRHEASHPADTPVELSVIAPCLNEELNVAELARRILGVFDVGQFVGELVLVDDGSTDGTAAAIRALADEYPGRVRGAFSHHNRGIAAAWRLGLGEARGKLVAIIDADLQYQPEDLLRLRRELYDHSVDVVQGWRSAVGRRKDQRYHISRSFNTLLNRVFSMDMRDNKSGFIMCAREVFQDLLSYKGSYFYWQSFIMVAAHAKGYSYKEVETLFEQRKQGTSFLEKRAVTASAKSIFDLGKAAWEYRVVRPPPDVANQFLRRYPVVDRSPERDPLASLRWRAYVAAYNRTHWIITRDVEHYYETLRRSQWLSHSQMRELQDEKLRRLVRHAYRNVPYYRSVMHARHLHPEDIRGQADLHKLPVLSKDDVRRHLCFDILSENHDKSDVLKITTSGATNEPFVCYADRSALEVRAAVALRAREWTGYKFGDACVRLWDEALGMPHSQAARDRADALLANRTLISAFALRESSIGSTLQAVAGPRPVLVEGCSEVLAFLADHALRSGGLDAQPRAVATSGQTLDRERRRLIEEAFGCRVFDEYGSRELPGIAYECEAHAGHHVTAETYIVEVLRDGEPASPGQMGEMVVTDLANTCMPLLRYRTGDRAEAFADQPCSCGRGGPRIGAIEGRQPSMIAGVDGRWLPGTFFAHYLKDFDYAIKRFQVVQTGPGAVQFRVVRAGRYSREVTAEILATFRRYLGDATRIDVELVDDLPLRSASGALDSDRLPASRDADVGRG